MLFQQGCDVHEYTILPKSIEMPGSIKTTASIEVHRSIEAPASIEPRALAVQVMTAQVLDGRALAAELRVALAARAGACTARLGRTPCLAVVLVGDDPASVAYAKVKARLADRIGVNLRLVRLAGDPAGNTESVVYAVDALNADLGVDAILVEMPLPAGYDEAAVRAAIAPEKDADGVAPANLGRLLAGQSGPRPATPRAVMAILDAAGTQLQGAAAVVVGRSAVVGKPLAMLLLARHATVTIAHSRTRELAAVTRSAEVLVSAAGVPGLIGAGHVRDGATVVDVGTTFVGEGAEGRMVGDVDFDAVLNVAGALTPVPGGVGPVTTAMVFQNTLDLAEARLA